MQHVKEATHIGGNLVEVIVTTDDDAQRVSCEFVKPTYFSDHHTVVCKLNAFNRRPSVVRYETLDVSTWQRFTIILVSHCFSISAISKCCSIDQYVELFQLEITCILDHHTPLKVKSRRVG
jgi:hypothetical protein